MRSGGGMSRETLYESLAKAQGAIGRYPQVTVGNKTYVGISRIERDWNKYSKSHHRKFGPAVSEHDRRVDVLDHETLKITTVREYDRWPAAPRDNTGNSLGPLQAVIDCVLCFDRSLVPLLMGQSPNIDKCLGKALSRKSPVKQKKALP
jgi:hypothetical protein